MKSIYNYLDYREFLKDYYAFNKESNPKFSYQLIADRGGFTSRGYVKHIIDGKRPLTINSLPKIIKGLKLNSKEAKYLEMLVKYNNTSDENEKREYYESLIDVPQRIKIYPLEKSEYSILNNSLHLVAFNLLELSDFPEKSKDVYAWAQKKLNAGISTSGIKAIFNDLIATNLVKIENGKIVKGERKYAELFYEENRESLAFHKKMILDSLDFLNMDVEDIMFSTFYLSFDYSGYPEIIESVKKFRQELIEKYTAEGDADILYQLNFQVTDVINHDDGL